MPIIKSAKKRVRVARRATARNAVTKRKLRLATKNLVAALENDGKKAQKVYSEFQSAIDQAVKKNVIHKNKAARKKQQLAGQAKAAGLKFQKTPVKSTPKPAPKSIAKKPVKSSTTNTQ